MIREYQIWFDALLNKRAHLVDTVSATNLCDIMLGKTCCFTSRFDTEAQNPSTVFALFHRALQHGKFTNAELQKSAHAFVASDPHPQLIVQFQDDYRRYRLIYDALDLESMWGPTPQTASHIPVSAMEFLVLMFSALFSGVGFYRLDRTLTLHGLFPDKTKLLDTLIEKGLLVVVEHAGPRYYLTASGHHRLRDFDKREFALMLHLLEVEHPAPLLEMFDLLSQALVPRFVSNAPSDEEIAAYHQKKKQEALERPLPHRTIPLPLSPCIVASRNEAGEIELELFVELRKELRPLRTLAFSDHNKLRKALENKSDLEWTLTLGELVFEGDRSHVGISKKGAAHRFALIPKSSFIAFLDAVCGLVKHYDRRKMQRSLVIVQEALVTAGKRENLVRSPYFRFHALVEGEQVYCEWKQIDDLLIFEQKETPHDQ